MFRLGLLRSALQLARSQQWKITDEASAIELFGQVPAMVKGSKDNIKITTPEDLELAAYFLQQQADDPV
jgi:2-C-methyl-D-erythritol 4-phosphate cytidylyltransferase